MPQSVIVTSYGAGIRILTRRGPTSLTTTHGHNRSVSCLNRWPPYRFTVQLCVSVTVVELPLAKLNTPL
jgi:hypothetical protein